MFSKMSFPLITAIFVAFFTTFIFLAHAKPQRRRRINKEQQFHEYNTLLKTENRTEFPDRDIRSLLNPGLRSPSKLKTEKNSRDSPRLQSSKTNRQQHFGSSKSDLPLTLTDGHGRFPHNLLSNGPLLSTSTATSTSLVSSSSSSSSLSSSHTDVDVQFTPSSTRRQKKKKKSKRKHRKHDGLAQSSSTTWDSNPSSDANELEAKNLDALLPGGKDSSHSRKKNSGRRKKSSKERRRKHKRKRRRGKKRQRKMTSSKTSMVLTHKSNFPPLKERCKTRPMQQEIKIKGCAPKTITNNFCYGQCNSFYIPELQGRGDGPPSFVSCSFCRPRIIRHVIVQLRCTGRNGRTRWKKKKVPYIKQCKCIAQPTDNCF